MGQNCSSVNGELLGECPNLEAYDSWNQGHEFFPDSLEEILDIITVTTATLSCLGSLFIIFTFLKFQQVRTFPYRLALNLSICDLGAEMWYLPLLITHKTGVENRTGEPDAWCFAIGTITQFFTIAGFIWTVVISYNVYFSIILNIHTHSKKMTAYHVWTWSIAAVFAALPAIIPVLSQKINNASSDDISSGYGFYNNWCWIANDAKLLAIICFDLPLFITIALITLFYCLSIQGLHSKETAVEGLRGRLQTKLHLYLFVFLACRFFGVVNRIAQLVAPCCPVFGLWVMQELFTPLQGIGNAIVYGLNYTIRTLYRVHICSRQRLAESPSQIKHIQPSSTIRKSNHIVSESHQQHYKSVDSRLESGKKLSRKSTLLPMSADRYSRYDKVSRENTSVQLSANTNCSI